jgi:hypothetical protein
VTVVITGCTFCGGPGVVGIIDHVAYCKLCWEYMDMDKMYGSVVMVSFMEGRVDESTL